MIPSKNFEKRRLLTMAFAAIITSLVRKKRKIPVSKKGNLFLLIKSLSKNEKRYLRIYAGRSGRAANYLQLFDAIDEQNEYDEVELRRKLKGKKFLSQLHVTKIYLTELILKALKNYHSDTSIHTRLLDLLKDVELLFNKELYDLCHYKLEKAEELADNYGQLSLLTEVLFWKRKLALAVSANRNDLHNVINKEKETIEQMKVLNTYWHHTTNIGSLINDDHFLVRLTKTKTNKYTLQSRVLHYHLLYGVHFIKGNLKNAEKHISELIEVLETYPERIKEDPYPYVTAIGNKIGLYLSSKRWDDIPGLISRIRETPFKYGLKTESRSSVRLWLRMFNVELEMYRDSRQLDKGIALIDEIQNFIKKRRKAVPADYILLFYYQFANIFFLKKQYATSLRWLNEIINSNFGTTREDIQSYARILNLMVHFELNNIIVLRYALDSCRRFVKKKKMEITSGKKILNLFSKLSHSYPDEYQAIFKNAYAEIFPPNSGQRQDYIDLKGWLEEKIIWG
jgi:tetratricopeptide (TPR) repeat protein